MRRVEDLGLIGQAFILIGVGPLRSAKAAEWMRTHVPGMHIPTPSSSGWQARKTGARRS